MSKAPYVLRVAPVLGMRVIVYREGERDWPGEIVRLREPFGTVDIRLTFTGEVRYCVTSDPYAKGVAHWYEERPPE